MGSHSSRSSTETSRYIWRRSKPTRAAWWSFATRCEDILASQGMPPNNSMQRTELRNLNFPRYFQLVDLHHSRLLAGPVTAVGAQEGSLGAPRDTRVRVGTGPNASEKRKDRSRGEQACRETAF